MYHHNNASGDATMLATPSTVVDPLWYPDSGASHHITHDDSTLSTKNTYTGSDKVNIGNGTGLNIHHVGHSYLHCPKFSKVVILNNLLHVPSITKNLLSVSQFARDNHVFFEFYPDFCTVKTQGTRETVLQGQLRGGLYVFPPMHKVQPALAFSAEKSSSHSRFTLWHSRLGHPSPKILKVALRNSHIPCNNFPDSVLCESCCMGKAHQLPFINSNSEYHTPLQLVFSDISSCKGKRSVPLKRVSPRAKLTLSGLPMRGTSCWKADEPSKTIGKLGRPRSQLWRRISKRLVWHETRTLMPLKSSRTN
uniref:Retrovirus-related Pol polyprotein from transposon TNT 1-94 n=1 Tax=Cajanus cajan TaxID=3821 RepID=A0A151RDX4_CAJCA|nr:Retrovirus-related Pol polyprotein from transposon TNT 1-94 [Cajanus cajan]